MKKKKTIQIGKAKHTFNAKDADKRKKRIKALLTFAGILLAAGLITVCMYFITRPYSTDYIMSTLRASYSVDGTAMTLSCVKTDYGYFFAFPEGCDFDTLTFEHRGEKNVFISDNTLENGEPAAYVKGPGQYKVSVGKYERIFAVSDKRYRKILL